MKPLLRLATCAACVAVGYAVARFPGFVASLDAEFGWDLDAPPPNPTFAAKTEARIFDWARAEADLADRSEP